MIYNITNDIYNAQSIPTDADTLATESIESTLWPAVVCLCLLLRGIVVLTQLIVLITLFLLLLCSVRSRRGQVVGPLCLVIIILRPVTSVKYSTLDKGSA